MRKLIQGLGLLAAAFFVTAAACGGSADKGATISTPGGPAVEDPADEPAEAAASAAAKIGDAVAFDKSTWTVTLAENKGQKVESGNEFIDSPETTGAFWYVEATVKNTGTEAFYIDTPKIVDSTGRQFDQHIGGASLIADKSCALENLNPGLEKSCGWLYEVPADAAGLSLAIKPDMFGDPTMVSLGQ